MMDYFGEKALDEIRAAHMAREASMSYVDDWGSTPPDVQAVLKETCQYPVCGHMRYRHGRTVGMRVDYVRVVQYEPGGCTSCRCPVFRTDAPISADQVLDAVVALEGAVTMGQFGIPTICPEVVARWSGGLTTQGVACQLPGGHEGGHTA